MLYYGYLFFRNIYPYELYVTGGDYESEIQKIQSKNRKKCMSDVMIEDDAGSFTNVDGGCMILHKQISVMVRCLTPLSTIFQFYRWRNSEDLRTSH